MSDWKVTVKSILTASTGDLRELAAIAGVDVRSLYRFQDLSRCDLRGQDLRGIDLTGTNIENAVVDSSTKIDEEFDFRFKFSSEYLTFKINRDLNLLINKYANHAKYRYEAWAYKSLIDRSIKLQSRGMWPFYIELIEGNPNFVKLVDTKSKGSMLAKTIQVYRHHQEFIHDNIGFSEEKIFSWILAIGVISVSIRHNSRKDYSSIDPVILF